MVLFPCSSWVRRLSSVIVCGRAEHEQANVLLPAANSPSTPPPHSSCFFSSGMFSLRCPPFWCWRPQYTPEVHSWTLSRLLLTVLLKVQVHHLPAVWWPTAVRTSTQPHRILSTSGAGRPGLLLPSSAGQWETEQKSGSCDCRLWRLPPAVPGGGG